MELRQLTYFLAIADYGSMSDASKQLHVSQPAISGALKDLETELGFSLFDRRGKRLHINQNGIYFATHVRKIFATLNDVQETIKISIAQRENTIHCLVNTPLGTMGKTLFRGFHQANPEVSLQIGFAATTLFDSSACDIEIFGSAHDYPETNQLISLTHEDYVIAMPANHSLAHKSPLYLHDFKDEPFIFGEASEMRSTLELMFAQAGIKPLLQAKFSFTAIFCNWFAQELAAPLPQSIRGLTGTKMMNLPYGISTISILDVRYTRVFQTMLYHQRLL